MKGLLRAVCVAALLAGPAVANGKEEPPPTPGQTQEQGQGQSQGQGQAQGQAQGQSVHIEGGVGGIACDFGIALPGGSLCLPRSNRHEKIFAEAEALGLAYGEWARLRHICLHVARVKRTLGACPVAPLTNQDYAPGKLK